MRPPGNTGRRDGGTHTSRLCVPAPLVACLRRSPPGSSRMKRTGFASNGNIIWRMTMEKPVSVCVLVGSLRKASLNGMLANTLMSLAPSSMKLETVEIGQLPFFNQDLETAATPAPWTAFRQRIKAQQRLGPQAWCDRKLLAERDRGLRRQSSSAAVAGVSERADHAAARSLCRPCRQAV